MLIVGVDEAGRVWRMVTTSPSRVQSATVKRRSTRVEGLWSAPPTRLREMDAAAFWQQVC